MTDEEMCAQLLLAITFELSVFEMLPTHQHQIYAKFRPPLLKKTKTKRTTKEAISVPFESIHARQRYMHGKDFSSYSFTSGSRKLFSFFQEENRYTDY